MDSTLKRRGNDRVHVVSTWNLRGVFVVNYWWLEIKKTILILLAFFCFNGLCLSKCLDIVISLQPFTWRKLAIETLEQGVKCVQS